MSSPASATHGAAENVEAPPRGSAASANVASRADEHSNTVSQRPAAALRGS